MKYIEFIKKLDHKPNRQRFELIIAWLDQHNIIYRRQEYATGVNLVVDLGDGPQRIGISSHFDAVHGSGGANDNASAIAVCLDMIERFTAGKANTPGLRIFFFDEEENGLKGSTAYTMQYGVADLLGLINMELVGMGDKFALWPVNQKYTGRLLRAFEQCAAQKNISATRFDKIITNTADHRSFRHVGLRDAFTITCISDKDIKAADLYYKALQQGLPTAALYDILGQAPVFKHYHRHTDTWDKLADNAMAMTAGAIWDTVQQVS